MSTDEQATLGAFDAAETTDAAGGDTDHDDLDDADDLRGYVKSNMENIDKLLTVIDSVADDVSELQESAGEGPSLPDTDQNDARMFQ